MAESIYSDNSNFSIDSINVLDYILKYNTVTFINLEIIFNCDIAQIINKYSVSFALVNPNNQSIIYADFTPAGSDFQVLKNTIPIGGGRTSYTQSLSYFSTRFVDNNHLFSDNSTLTSNLPVEGTQMQLRVTVDGVHKYFNNRTFNTCSSSPMPIQTDTFNYLGTYPLILNNYYFQNTDDLYLKIDNQRAVTLDITSINNFSNIPAPLRFANTEFRTTSTATGVFSGTNSYLLTKEYSITSASTQVTIWIEKVGIGSKKINPTSQNTIHTKLQVGCDKLFDTTLKNASSVSDTVYLEFPLFRELSGLSITSIQVNSTPNKVSFASTPTVTSLGDAKFQVDFSYNPTNEPNSTSATYAATFFISFLHTSGISFTISASGFTFTNSTG